MKLFSRLRALWQRHPFLILRALLQRLPGQPLRLESFQRYQRNGAPLTDGCTADATVRVATSEDLDGLVACRDKRNTFIKRFACNDICLVASNEGQIVGYEWFSTRSEQIEERYGYAIPIPPDAIYAYDAYVAESARGQGVWTRIMAATGLLLKTSARQKLIAHIDLGNLESVAAHARLGFRPVRAYLYLRILGRSFLWSRDLAPNRIQRPV